MIDLDHVGVTGHSLGGYTTLAAAGAQLHTDWDNDEWLNTYPEIDMLELREMLAGHDKDLADLAGLDAVPEEVWPSWGDPRVDSIVPQAPSALLFDTQAMSKLTIPMMVLGGTADWLTPLPYSVNGVYDNWGGPLKAEVVFEDAGHMIFFLSCDLPLDG
jgi:predicted dienelactone hydrolase